MRGKTLCVFVSFIMISMIFSSVDIGAKDTLSFKYFFSSPGISEGKNGVEIGIEGCEMYEYGGILIPAKEIHILLPYGKDVSKIDVKAYGKKFLGEYEIEKAEPIIAGNKRIVLSSTSQIHRIYEKVGVYSLRGYRILVMDLFPLSYDHGKVFYYSSMEVNVELKSKENSLYRGFEKDREWVSRYIDNDEMLATYPLKKCGEKYEYVIITAEKFRNVFQPFVDYKKSRGINATIFTVEEIKINPSFWNSTPMFNDTAAKIRNFIRYAYLNWGTDYVLLGGDADVMNASDNIIPARRLYATCVGLPLAKTDVLEAYIPSDVYYACLDGNFNDDMDDKWGENATGNDAGNKDEADLYAEIWVGRACVDSIREVNNFINKTIAYEESSNEYAIMQFLLVGEYLGFGKEAEWGGNHMDKLIPLIPSAYNITKLYERDREWNKYDLAGIMNRGVNIVNHLGHGWTTYALQMSNSDLRLLRNNDYFFLYSQTCLAGSFDNWYPEDHYYEDDCFAEHLTLDEHGAFACIMNSRYGLGRENSTDSPGERFDISFLKALFQENIKELGRANHYSKEDNVWRINENGMRWIYYETNLFGDPQVRIKEPSQTVEIDITLEKPTKGIYLFDFGPLIPSINGTVILGGITIEASVTTNPENALKDVRIYIDNELKATLENPPYKWKWNEQARGKHKITVEACATNGKCESVEEQVFIINLL